MTNKKDTYSYICNFDTIKDQCENELYFIDQNSG